MIERKVVEAEPAGSLSPLEGFDETIESLRIGAWVAQPAACVAPWKLAVPQGQSCFYAVLNGKCRLENPAGSWNIPLVGGDLAIVRGDGSLLLRDDSNAAKNGEAKPTTRLLCGGFVPPDDLRSRSLFALPPVIRVPGERGEFVLWAGGIIRLLEQEAALGRGRSQAVINRLAGVLLIKAARHHEAALPAGDFWSGHFPRDEEIAAALERMHARPDFAWTVARLAEEIGLSRSTFAARFTKVVGRPPLDYLREVRLKQAARLLREGNRTLKEIAARTGYKTSSAFSNAFRQWSGAAPGEFRRLQAEPLSPESRESDGLPAIPEKA